MRLKLYTLLFAFLLPLAIPAQVTGLAGWDIYLDPGHSRDENMGIYNYSEARKNLRVALNLRSILLTKTDIDTVWSSRYNDQVQVSLSQRTDQANALGASWYHSIHSNAGSPSANNTLLLWGQYYNGLEKVPNGGKAMSSHMIDLLTRTMRIPTIGSWGDCSFYGTCSPSFFGPYLHVNRNSNMPSELSESGFHTNPEQNTLNMNAEWKRMEAYSFFWSILEFHNIPRPPVGIAAGIIFDLERNRPLNGAHISVNGQEYTTDTYESLFYQYTSDPELLHNGYYFFEDLPVDTTLEIIVSAEGFHSDTAYVAISDTFITFHDVDLVDARPPKILSSVPEPNAVDISVLDDIKIDFSRRMNTAAVAAAISFDPPVNFSTSWLNSNRNLTIKPDTLEFETTYTLTIDSSATDLFAHLLDGNGDGIAGDHFVLIFTTEEADISPPQVAASYPAPGATEVENPLVINFEFDELIMESSISSNSIILEKAGGGGVAGTVKHYEVNEKSLLSFFPGDLLDPDTEYLAKIQPGLKDVFGNELQNELVYNFTTGGFSYSISSIDNFEGGLLSNWLAPQQSGSTTGIISTQTSMQNNSQTVNLLTGSTRSMRLNYAWDTNASSWLIREYLSGGPPREVLFNTSYLLQMYVFGDGSGNRIRFAIDDNVPTGGSNDHEVSLWVTLDWVGWKLVTWDLANDPVGSWIGNGVLNGTLRFDSIQLTYVPGAATSGTVYIDDLRLAVQVPVGIDEDETVSVLPEKYALYQNYPNPFNPSTTIAFDLPESGAVKLTVYDVLGREVKTLLNGRRSAGRYEVRFDASDLASGVYLYRLEAGRHFLTRRMLLVK